MEKNLCLFKFNLGCLCIIGWPQFAYIFFFTGELYGLEKFWAFRKYYKDWSVVESHVDPFLSRKITEYKTVDDFRLDVSDFSDDTLFYTNEFY